MDISDLRLSPEEVRILFASIVEEDYQDEGSPQVVRWNKRPGTPTTEEEEEESSSTSTSSPFPSEDEDEPEDANGREWTVQKNSRYRPNPTTVRSPPPPPTTTASSSVVVQVAKEILRHEQGIGDENCTIPTEDVISAAKMAQPDELDALLAAEMSNLSIEERDQATRDIYGVAAIREETPELVQNQLQQFEKCIQTIRKKDAYEQALYLSPEYVQDENFRLMFLRSAQFVPPKAAEQMVLHFEMKLKLFGKGALVRDITQQDDFHEKEDADILASGAFQLLPIRDRADRAIIIVSPVQMRDSARIKRIRAAWYIMMTALRDVTSQRNGFVFVCFHIGDTLPPFDEIYHLKECEPIRQALPDRMVGAHYCFDEIRIKPFVLFARLLMSKYRRQRFQIHFGTRNEQLYKLQTYGIPTHVLPFDESGNLVLDDHLTWLQQRRAEELSTTGGRRKDIILIPRRFDVLFGKGANVAEHTGNLRAYHIVQMNRTAYESASKYAKTNVAERIVKLIQQSYGRFLKYDRSVTGGGGWVEVSQEDAREKISHFFRRIREMEQKRRKQQPQPGPGGGDGSSSTTTTTKRTYVSVTKQSGKKSPSSVGNKSQDDPYKQ